MGFPDSSVGKESACNAEDPSSIPGSGRSPGEGERLPTTESDMTEWLFHINFNESKGDSILDSVWIYESRYYKSKETWSEETAKWKFFIFLQIINYLPTLKLEPFIWAWGRHEYPENGWESLRQDKCLHPLRFADCREECLKKNPTCTPQHFQTTLKNDFIPGKVWWFTRGEMPLNPQGAHSSSSWPPGRPPHQGLALTLLRSRSRSSRMAFMVALVLCSSSSLLHSMAVRLSFSSLSPANSFSHRDRSSARLGYRSRPRTPSISSTVWKTEPRRQGKWVPGKKGKGRTQASCGRVSTEGWLPRSLHWRK